MRRVFGGLLHRLSARIHYRAHKIYGSDPHLDEITEFAIAWRRAQLTQARLESRLEWPEGREDIIAAQRVVSAHEQALRVALDHRIRARWFHSVVRGEPHDIAL